MNLIKRQLTLSNVLALTALFIALGGTAWAVNANSIATKHLKNGAVTTPKLAKNAVTAPKIRQNAVTSAKVRDGSLTKADLHASTLEGIDAASVGGKTAGQLESKGVQEWQQLVLNDGFEESNCFWSNYGFGFQPAAYYRDRGRVYLRGLVRAVDGDMWLCGNLPPDDRNIGSLPPGYRPDSRTLFTTSSNNKPARVDVDPDGVIGIEHGYPTYTDAKQWVSLDGISFRCEC